MKFDELLKTKDEIIFDGAIGTQLELRGAPVGPLSNIAAPDKVLEIHKAYIDAGADVIITNTFTMNPIFANGHDTKVDIVEINRAGVTLAKKAAAGDIAVLGGMGPTGQLLAPLGTYTEDQFYAAYLEQARILADCGVDGFILETMTDLRESLCGLRACKENFNLPVIVSFAYSTEAGGGRTSMGNKAADCARQIEAAGAAAVGANCGTLDHRKIDTVVKEYRAACAIPLLVEPNAGKPRLEGDKTMYDMPPADFAETLRACIAAGATLLGGCCGTSPDHIREIAKLLGK